MFSAIILTSIVAAGFVLNLLYKRSVSAPDTLKISPNTILKWFMIVFVIGVVSVWFISRFTMNTLREGEHPDLMANEFQDSRSVFLFAMNTTFFVLSLLAVFYSQASKKLMWVPFALAAAFYLLFVIKEESFMTSYFLNWKKTMGLLKGVIEVKNASVGKCISGLVATGLNMLFTWWGLRK